MDEWIEVYTEKLLIESYYANPFNSGLGLSVCLSSCRASVCVPIHHFTFPNLIHELNVLLRNDQAACLHEFQNS